MGLTEFHHSEMRGGSGTRVGISLILLPLPRQALYPLGTLPRFGIPGLLPFLAGACLLALQRHLGSHFAPL